MQKAFATNVKVYAIGGLLNETLLGTATDGTTGYSLLMYAQKFGSKSVSLHGTFCHKEDGNGELADVVSGEMSITDAAKMFEAADAEMAARRRVDEMRPW